MINNYYVKKFNKLKFNICKNKLLRSRNSLNSSNPPNKVNLQQSKKNNS